MSEVSELKVAAVPLTLAEHIATNLTQSELADMAGIMEISKQMGAGEKKHVLTNNIANMIYNSESGQNMGIVKLRLRGRKNKPSRFVKGVDYGEISPSTISYQVIGNSMGEKKETRGRKAIPLWITTDCLKKLVLNADTDASWKMYDYLISVEKAMMSYGEYQANFQTQQLTTQMGRLQITEEKHAAELAAATAKLERMKLVNKKLVEMKQASSRDEEVYIMSSRLYAEQGLFKIGTGKRALTRLKQFNTGRAANDQLVVLHTIKCHNGHDLESRIHRMIVQFKDSTNREFFFAPYLALRNICDHIATNYEDDIDTLNTMIAAASTQLIEASADYCGGIDGAVFDASRALTYELTDEKMREIIEIVVANQLGLDSFSFDDVLDKDSWDAFKKTLKSAGKPTSKIKVGRDTFFDEAKKFVGDGCEKILLRGINKYIKAGAWPYGLKKKV
jgi:hypothetical protein